MQDYYYCSKNIYFPTKDILQYVQSQIQKSKNKEVSFEHVFQGLRKKFHVTKLYKENLYTFLEQFYEIDSRRMIHEKNTTLFEAPYNELKDFFRATLITKFDSDIQIILNEMEESKLKESLTIQEIFDKCYDEFQEKYSKMKGFRNAWESFQFTQTKNDDLSIFPFCSNELVELFKETGIFTIRDFNKIDADHIAQYYHFSDEILSLHKTFEQPLLENFWKEYQDLYHKNTKAVLSMRFDNKTLLDISKELNISKTRVGQVEEDGIYSLNLFFTKNQSLFLKVFRSIVQNPIEITKNELIELFPESWKCIVYYSIKKNTEDMHYLVHEELFNISGVAYETIILKEIESKDLVQNDLEQSLMISEFVEKFDYKVSSSTIESIVEDAYENNIIYYYKKNSTVQERVNYVLKTYYPIGITKTEFDEFVLRYSEIFKMENITKKTLVYYIIHSSFYNNEK